jgi:hypothetical protein
MAAVINNPTALVRGRPVKLGTLTAIDTAVQFSIPEPSRDHQGYMAIQVPSGLGGTIIAVLEVSLDGGVTWGVQPPAPAGIGGEGIGTPMVGDIAAKFAATYVMSGLAGATLRFGFTSTTTITSADVWVMIG